MATNFFLSIPSSQPSSAIEQMTKSVPGMLARAARPTNKNSIIFILWIKKLYIEEPHPAGIPESQTKKKKYT